MIFSIPKSFKLLKKVKFLCKMLHIFRDIQILRLIFSLSHLHQLIICTFSTRFDVKANHLKNLCIQ